MNAKIVGYEPTTDLAVLEVHTATTGPVAEFGESSRLQVGESVIAIGNPLGLSFSRTVTHGIISSTDRMLPNDLNGNQKINVLQTDAPINTGNGGGPLVNLNGQVIGIVSTKIVQDGVQGIGFAIPIDNAKKIVNNILARQNIKLFNL